MRTLAWLTACALVGWTLGVERVEAQKARSSGASGRSYSSGRSSAPSRSAPSPSRSAPTRSAPSPSRSAPAPSRPPSSSGKSYSSGSRSASPSTPSRTPAPSPAPAGKSYSSGPRPSSPTTGVRPPPGGSGKSYSSGSPPRTTPAPPASAPAPTTPPPVSPSGKSYTSRSPAPPGASTNPAAPPSGRSYEVPSARPTPGYDTKAAEALRHEESRRAYRPGPAPKPQYTDPRTDTTFELDRDKDRRIEQLRRELDHERWVNRPSRFERSYGGYPPAGWTVVNYRDPYSDWFWWWLLTQNLQTRSDWLYHHRSAIDEARYREMLRRDAQVEARLRELEEKKLPRDPNYTPPGVDHDLMFDDSYVDAVYNPTPDPSLAPAPRQAPAGGGFRTFFLWLCALALVAFLIWLVFFKRWNVS